MIDGTRPHGEAPGPMAGRRLHHPLVIAAYTLYANVPLGMILCGLNLRARGERGFAGIMLSLGGVCAALLVVLTIQGAIPLHIGVLNGLVAAYFFIAERAPYERAIGQGASRARWWPPAIWVLAATLLLWVFTTFEVE